jgi:hypothetical protein
VDFKISRSRDKTLVEMKLAKNTKLEQNLAKQAEIYQADRAVLDFVKATVFDPADFTMRSDGVVRLNPQLARTVAKIALFSLTRQAPHRCISCPVVFVPRHNEAPSKPSPELGEGNVPEDSAQALLGTPTHRLSPA